MSYSHSKHPPVHAKPREAAPPRQRAGGWTAGKQRLFLKTLAATGSVDQAATHVGMSISAAYRLRSHPAAGDFRAAWSRALMACVATARDVAFDRAFNGTLQPLIRNGEVKGSRTVFNDRLLMFLLQRYDHLVNNFHQPHLEERFVASLDTLADLPDVPPEVMLPDSENTVQALR